MEPTKPAKLVLFVVGVLMLVGWALIIWIATIVTHTAVEVLAYIVELAQLN